MAGTDILGALLKSVGTGVKQYGGELSARDQEKQQMAKTLKMQQIKDTVQADRDLSVLKVTNPRLAAKVEKMYTEVGHVFPLDEAHLKQFSDQLSAEDAKQQLEAQQSQMAVEGPMGNLARQSGATVDNKESPLGVMPLTKDQEYQHNIDWSTFGGPSLSQAQSDAASVPTRGRMSTPYDTFQEAAKIYVQKRVAAENERKKLNGKPEKPDAGSVLTDKELWTQYNSELNRTQSQYETDLNFYRSEMRQYEEKKSALEAEIARNNRASDRSKLNGLRPPNPPLYPPILGSYKADGVSAFRLWADKKRREFGGVNKPINLGGKRKLTPAEARQMLIDKGVEFEE